MVPTIILKQYLQTRLLDSVLESNTLKESLTFKNHLDLCYYILEMKLEDMRPLFLEGDIRAFESKMSKLLAYGLSALAGMYLGGGIAFSLVVTYLFRKAADPCWNRCLNKFGRPNQRDLCKYDCLVDASRMVVQELRSEISKCNDLPDPIACQKKLQGEYMKWAQRLQKYTIKLKKVQFSLQGKALNQTTSNITKNAESRVAAGEKPAQESVNPKKEEMINLVETSKILRQKLSFKDHIKLYNRVRDM